MSNSIEYSVARSIHVLQDVSSTGKKRPWQKRKQQSTKLSESYKRLGLKKKAVRVAECGSLLKFIACPEGHSKRLTGSNFCRVRMCPMCSWRKSLVNAHQVGLVTHEANQRQKLRWLFLTLTGGKTVQGSDLPAQLDRMFGAWKRLSERKAFKNAVVGYFRALEVTHSVEKDTYHPHFHVLIAVKPSYFTHGYIKQEEWAELWKKSMRLDYTPTVDIRKVKPKKDVRAGQDEIKAMESAIVETAKYPTKFSTVLVEGNEEATDSAVSVLDDALANRRLLGYGGLLKDIWQELKAKGKVTDVEDADLVNVEGIPEGCNCSTCGSNMLEEMYTWRIGANNYVKLDSRD